MNSLMTEYYPIFQMYQALRSQLLEIVSDKDLKFSPSDQSPTLGALCLEMGEVEHSYIESFKQFKQDFSYRNETEGLESNVGQLAAWYKKLDDDLKTIIEGFSDDQLNNQMIDRGAGFKLPPRIQLEVYKEALLIFYGKVSVYLKMMGKSLPEQWQEWIG